MQLEKAYPEFFDDDNTVYGQNVGEAGRTPKQWHAFQRMKTQLSTETLRNVVHAEESLYSPVFKCYALWALSERSELQVEDVLCALKDTRGVGFSLGGCFGTFQCVAWFALSKRGSHPLLTRYILEHFKGDLGEFSRGAARACKDLDLLLHSWSLGNPHALLAAAALSSDEKVVSAVMEICRNPNSAEVGSFPQRDERRTLFECIQANPNLIANDNSWTLFEKAALEWPESGAEISALLKFAFTPWSAKAASCLMRLLVSKPRFHLRWAYQNCVSSVYETRKPYHDPEFRLLAATLYQAYLSSTHYHQLDIHGGDEFFKIMASDPSIFLVILRTQFTVDQDREAFQTALKRIVESNPLQLDLSLAMTREILDLLPLFIPSYDPWSLLKGSWSPNTHKSFPREFRRAVVTFLLAVKRNKLCSRDICFLIINWATY